MEFAPSSRAYSDPPRRQHRALDDLDHVDGQSRRCCPCSDRRRRPPSTAPGATPRPPACQHPPTPEPSRDRLPSVLLNTQGPPPQCSFTSATWTMPPTPVTGDNPPQRRCLLLSWPAAAGASPGPPPPSGRLRSFASRRRSHHDATRASPIGGSLDRRRRSQPATDRADVHVDTLAARAATACPMLSRRRSQPAIDRTVPVYC